MTIDLVLKFLAGEVNTYFAKRTGSNLGQIELGGVVDDTGKWTITKNRVGLSLVNVEEERTLRGQLPEQVFVNGRQVTLQPALKLNLHLMFAAHFSTYDHSLRYLSHVLTFFQSHPVFTPDQYPGLDAGIEKLTVEMLAYGPEQLNQLWAYLGGKYLPSVVYKIRMVVLQDIEPEGIGQPITHIDTAVHAK